MQTFADSHMATHKLPDYQYKSQKRYHDQQLEAPNAKRGPAHGADH